MPTLDGYQDGDIVFEIVDLVQEPITSEIHIRYKIRIKRKDGWSEFRGTTQISKPVVVTRKEINDGHANEGGRGGEATGN